MSIAQGVREWCQKKAPRRLAVGVLFVLALGGGLTLTQSSWAAPLRDCSANSINNKDLHGGCGAPTPTELCQDMATNDPSDLQGIYAHFGLPISACGRFEQTARLGTALQNGDIVVDGETVMTNAWSIGRTQFSYSTPFPISGVGNYFKSMHTDVLKQDLPVMVMFDQNGTPEFAVLTPCSNAVQGNKVKSSAECRDLKKTPVDGKENTFAFTTDAPVTGLAKVEKVEYFVDGELFATETNPLTPVTKTFTQDATVSVKVFVSLPGKQQRVIVSEECTQKIVFKKKEVPPPVTPPTPTPPPPTPITPAKQALPPPPPPQPLPKTGAEGAVGLFVAATTAGTFGHHFYRSRRKK